MVGIATVLSQQSSFYRFGPIPSHNLSEQLLKLEESIKFTVYIVIGTSEKYFNPTQTLFWKKNTVSYKLKYLYLYLNENMLYRMVSTLHCLCTQWTHRSTGQVGHFLRKDDSCDITLVIYSTVHCIIYLWRNNFKWEVKF